MWLAALGDTPYGQLSVATGCIASLKQTMFQETEEEIRPEANPFGPYALVRNALDAAAVAMWLLDPDDGTLRIERRLMFGVDEVNKTDTFRRTMNQPSAKAGGHSRLQEVAEVAGLAGWNTLGKDSRLPPMTEILKDLERLHPNAGLLMRGALGSIYPDVGQMLSALGRSHPQTPMPWLGAWKLASGHAHGKQWAQINSHGLEEVKGTRTGSSSHFLMSIHYGMFAAVLSGALQLLEVAAARYVKLSGGQLA